MNSKENLIPSIPIGEYRMYRTCRFCCKKISTPTIDLGILPLAGGFIEKNKIGETEFYYPLTLGFCTSCKMLQTIEVVDSKTLFSKYYYSTSKIKTLSNHLISLADEISVSLKKEKSFVVEIGANDGVLIKNLSRKGFKTLGVDPAKNIVIPQIKKGVSLMCDFFSLKTSEKILQRYGKADVVTSSNSMAHIENITEVYKGIKRLLKKSGYAIVEVHYLKKIIEEFQYDMIYHEHMYYYSTISMENILKLFDLELFDVREIPIHAGSIRFYIQHKKGPRKKNQNISLFKKNEAKIGLGDIELFTKFNKKLSQKKEGLIKLLLDLKRKDKTIAGYGASGRANTIMGYSNIDSQMLNYVIDDSKLKQGRFTPGNHLEIVSSKVLSAKKKPDFVLLFAWSFYNEILKRNKSFVEKGGKFILPLPDVKIVP